MHIKGRYRYTVTDVKGRVLARSRWRRSQSFVAQYTQMLLCCLSYANLAGVTDRAGNTHTMLAASASKLSCRGAVNNSNEGLVVGSGNTAVDIADYELDAPIAHGSGSGQLNHQAQTYSAHSVVDPEAAFTTTRVFQNGSGGSIIIREIGIACLCQNTTPISFYALAARDVLSSPATVPDGGAYTLEYEIAVTE